MTDTQVLTIVIAILASLGALIYNNSRITDVGKRIDDQHDLLGRRIDDLRAGLTRHIDDKYHLLDMKLDRIIGLIASHEPTSL